MTKPRGRALVLIERAEHVGPALQKHGRDPASIRFLALSSGAMQALAEAGIPYKTPEDYIAASALNRRGLENYDLLEKCGGWLEERLHALPERLRLNPIHLHYYRLKIFLDSIGLRVMEMRAVFEAETPAEIAVCAGDDDPLWAGAGDSQFMIVDGPVYAVVAPFVAAALGLTAVVERLPGRRASRCRRVLDRLRPCVGLAWKIQRFLWRRLAVPRGKPVLWQIGDMAHDMPFALSLLSDRFRVDLWGNAFHGPFGGGLSRLFGQAESNEDLLQLRRFWSDISGPFSERALFDYSGINCFSLFSPLLEKLFVGEHRKAARFYHALRRFIRRSPPRAAITIHSPLWANTAACWALRAEQIPVIYMQEGGLYGYCHHPMYHYCELAFGDYFLAYGPNAANYINQTRLGPRQGAKAVAVGSLRLRRMLKTAASKPASRVETVMYVPTLFHHNVRYAPMWFDEREYYKLRKRILEALLTVPKLKIVYKAVPNHLEADSLKSLLARHRDRIETIDAPLTCVLGRADAYVIDWPNTSMLELLTTERPIWVLLDRETTLSVDAALPSLERRAHVFQDLASLERGLRGIAETDAKAVDDRSFLEAYGVGDLKISAPDILAGLFDRIVPEPQFSGHAP